MARDYDAAMAAVPFEFIDRTSLIGPRDRVRDRLQRLRRRRRHDADRRDLRRQTWTTGSPRCARWPRSSTSPAWPASDVVRGDRPGRRPGPHGVPADLVERAPADPVPAVRLGGPGRRLHRGHADRHGDRRHHLLPPGDRRDPAGLGPLDRRWPRRGTSRPRAWAGSSSSARSPSPSSASLFTDQIETVARNLWLIATMLIVFGLDPRRRRRTRRPGEGRARPDGARRHPVRPRAVAGPDPRRLPLRRDASRRDWRWATRAGPPPGTPSCWPCRRCWRPGCSRRRKIGDEATVAWGPTILATVIAFSVGFAVIAWLMRWLTTKSYLPFVLYRSGSDCS